MTIEILKNSLKTHSLGADLRDLSDDFLYAISELHECLWGIGESYRTEEVYVDNGYEDQTAFFEVEAIDSEEFISIMNDCFEFTDEQRSEINSILEEHYQEGVLYFIREWCGNDNNVDVFEVYPTIYSDLKKAQEDCDEYIKDYATCNSEVFKSHN